MDLLTPPTTGTPSGLREAVIAPLLRGVLRLAVKPCFAPWVPIAAQRARLQRFIPLNRLPKGSRVEPAMHGGVPGEWLHPPHAPVKAGRVLYLHGGAFCVGSPATHRALTARLARDLGLSVFSTDYRLAPEHPYPAALDDALAAYRALSAEGPVIVAGDSAGGTLVLLLAQALRDRGETPPACLLLLSPLVDLTMSGLPDAIPGEALLSKPWVSACIDHFRAGLPADDPRVSPWHGRLDGLPPTFVQWGSDEIFAPGCGRLVAALYGAGVTATADVVANRWHVFALHAGTLPSADAALGRAARFALPHLEAATPPRAARHDVVVLGAGMSGLCMLHTLKQAGIHDVVALEKQPGLGGTWWDNRYPGAQVDVPAPAYAFSFAPNRHWPQRFADAPDIHAYQEALAAREGLLGHLRLGTALVSATWDESAALWRFRTAKGDTLESRFFVCSTGPLSQPRWPAIPGLDDFEGPKLHTARWHDDDRALDGQRIGVIGTGSTAVQLIPKLAARASKLEVFQRTPNWVLPRLERRYRWFDRWLMRVPGYAPAVRLAWAGFLEWTRRGFDEGTVARRFMLGLARWHRRRQLRDAPDRAALESALAPPYPLGCKRIIYANDYYPTLAQPHVALVTDGIARITADGIVTTDGREHRLDALVCATGFETVNLLGSITINGCAGRTLAEAWRDGPVALHGIGVAGFPNLFLMLGPNTATGHTSTLFYIEAAARHALAVMQRVRERGGGWAAVKPEAMAAHDASLQARLRGSIWTQCRSWYRMEDGRVIAIFPGFTPEYVRKAGTLEPADYHWG
ncbi:alpha/beta hydrolase fold domain-containing protein [Silanimonas sp.]|uniref:alpha/beta hydrolase fold domain-containing protein n=1 Tax=Silanimonas sp. TaxID=1929290 RepID=UPI0022CC967C|nr:alpha/beta hydrolase fold domain-containing protein [Silanimonas sp.]MCZ8062480.1 alpha/beta hydrolase fold domain-containing protein [Silanimonas sp.]